MNGLLTTVLGTLSLVCGLIFFSTASVPMGIVFGIICFCFGVALVKTWDN